MLESHLEIADGRWPIDFETEERRGAKGTEIREERIFCSSSFAEWLDRINSLRGLCVLCVSALNQPILTAWF
jgi:hypothetical protein